MKFKKFTIASLKKLGRSIDSVVLDAPKLEGVGGLYEKINRVDYDQWTTIRGPVWIGKILVIMLIRPRNDEACPHGKWPDDCGEVCFCGHVCRKHGNEECGVSGCWCLECFKVRDI